MLQHRQSLLPFGFSFLYCTGLPFETSLQEATDPGKCMSSDSILVELPFRRKLFRKYDILSHMTYGRCDFTSSTTFD